LILSTPSSGGGSGTEAAPAAPFGVFAPLPVLLFIPAESRSSCVFSSPVSPSLSITLRKLTRPLRISSSPIGERQFTGGFMSFVAAIALCSSSAIARFCASTRGRTGFLPHATFERISPAAAAETRLKVVWRKPRTSWLFDSPAASISAPSSTPWGCGLISAASLGSSSVARGKTSVSLPGRSVPARCAAPTGRV
jgi:hypothetical protein